METRKTRLNALRAHFNNRKRVVLRSATYRASAEALSQLNIGELTSQQRQEFDNLTEEFADIFAMSKQDLGRTDVLQHKIDLEPGARPVKQRAYRPSPENALFQSDEVDKMLKMKLITESESPWSSPVVVVGKKTGDKRFCVDYRKLNSFTKENAYPLPVIQELLDQMGGARYYSSLDLLSGYWQVEMAPEDREKTAFVTADGLFEFVVMPFGLCNAPSSRLPGKNICSIYAKYLNTFARQASGSI